MEPTSNNIARRVAQTYFEARKGHGGGPCSYVQMRPADLMTIIESAIDLYVVANKKTAS